MCGDTFSTTTVILLIQRDKEEKLLLQSSQINQFTSVNTDILYLVSQQGGFFCFVLFFLNLTQDMRFEMVPANQRKQNKTKNHLRSHLPLVFGSLVAAIHLAANLAFPGLSAG